MFSVLVFETTGPIFAKIAIKRAGEIGGMDREPVIQPASEPRPDTAFEDGHAASIPFPAALAEVAENA